MRETRETALLNIACGKPARRRYCMHGSKVQLHQLIACIFIYSTKWPYVKTMNAKNTREKSAIHENADANITCDHLVTVTSAVLGVDFHTRTRARPDGHIASSIIVRCLARFNKIAIQGTPQMAVDTEAIRLSRVCSYDSKCRPMLVSM